MFIGIREEKSNREGISYLENVVMFPEAYLDRLLLVGNNHNENRMLVNIVASILSVKGYKVASFEEEQIINSFDAPLDNDIIIVHNIFCSEKYSDNESLELEHFLDTYQHKTVILVFNNSFKKLKFLRENGILRNDSIWSRNVLGCKQIFMNLEDKELFKDFVKLDERGDYRIIKTLEHLKQKIEPYDEIKGITKCILKQQMLRGDNSKNNTLIIDKKFEIRLVELSDAKEMNPPVRLESFGRGGEFVGVELSDYDMERYMKLLLQGYYDFLTTGNNQYVDYCRRPKETCKDTIFKIKEHLLRD